MNSIATQVPTTLDELADCDLPQNVIKQYGERLIKSINAYIEKEKLEQYIENRPKKKPRARVTLASVEESKPILIDVDTTNSDDDEFGDNGIDFSAIEIPKASAQTSKAPSGAAAAPTPKPNPYGQTAHKRSKLKSKKSSYF